MKHWVINLKRVPERAAYMIGEAKRVGLGGLELVPAIDAKGRNAHEISSLYKPSSWGAYWSLSPSEVACFESHKMLWEKCAAENDGGCIIYEDDIVMSKSLPKVIDILDRQVEHFDMVHLDAGLGNYQLGPPFDLGGVELAPILQPLSSTAIYALSPTGARKLLAEASKGYCDHTDDFVTRPRRGYRIFQLLPAVALQGMFAQSDMVDPVIRGSERTSDPKMNPKLDRGPLPYRLAKELRR